MIALGLDPGYAITGWGVVSSGVDGFLRPLSYGVIRTETSDSSAEKLSFIYKNIKILLEEYHPDCAVVESLFFSSNKKTAAGVYQARGAILAALGERPIVVLELGPGTIKNAVTGSGRAVKRDIIRMTSKLLGIKEKISPDDAADALAGAIAGCVYQKSKTVIEARAGMLSR